MASTNARPGLPGQPFGSYPRRAPERTVLELVARHAQSMLAELRDADPDGGSLPRYVEFVAALDVPAALAVTTIAYPA